LCQIDLDFCHSNLVNNQQPVPFLIKSNQTIASHPLQSSANFFHWHHRFRIYSIISCLTSMKNLPQVLPMPLWLASCIKSVPLKKKCIALNKAAI